LATTIMKLRTTSIALAALAAVAVACSSSSPPDAGGTATVTGTLGGNPVATTGVVAILATVTNAGVTSTYFGVNIKNKPGAACNTKESTLPPNLDYLDLEFGGPGATAPPGTYVIAQPQTGPNAYASYVRTDASCQVTGNIPTATSGTIDVTTVSDGVVAATFDLTFDSGERISGHFSTPYCGFALDPDAGSGPGLPCGS
jgi:hypothetical protein